jgi:hypothetical protein
MEWILFISIAVVVFYFAFRKADKQEEVNKQNKSDEAAHSSSSTEELNNIIKKIYEQNPLSRTDEEVKAEAAERLARGYIKNNVKSAIPTKEGLYPHEVLILACAPGHYIYEKDTKWIWFEHRYGCGRKEVQSILNSLMEKKFLHVGGMYDTLNRETVKMLKITCQAFDIKKTGKKEEIIQEMLRRIPDKELQKRFPNQIYALTATGEKIVKKNEYIPYINGGHVREDLTIWSLNKLVNMHLHKPWRVVIWEYLEKCKEKHLEGYKFISYKWCCYSMAHFLRESKEYERELVMLAEIAYFKLSGLFHIPFYQNDFIRSFFPYKESSARLDWNELIDGIFYCRDKLDFTDHELEQFLLEQTSEIKGLPFYLFTKEECVEIIFYERDRDFNKLKEIYIIAEKRFRNNYPGII